MPWILAAANGIQNPVECVFRFFDQYPAVPIGMLVVVFIIALARRRGGPSGGSFRAKAGSTGFLDRVVLDPGGIPFTGRMATEGIFTCAELGGGKTFLVFQRVLKAYVRAGMGGYLLGAKSEDLETVRKLFRAPGAEGKLAVTGPKHGHRINAFEALAGMAPPDSVEEEIIGIFTSLMEIENRKASKSGGEDTQFFVSHGQRLLGAILACLRLAGETMTAANICRFLVSLPQSRAEIGDARRRAGYANQCIGKAYNAAKSPREEADYENAHAYLLGELANLNDRTKSSIISNGRSSTPRKVRATDPPGGARSVGRDCDHWHPVGLGGAASVRKPYSQRAPPDSTDRTWIVLSSSFSETAADFQCFRPNG